MPVVPETSFAIRAGALALDARMARPDHATTGCVICHPHPLYGGDMRNPVVLALADSLQEAGLATLRFDFRGAGSSDGVHSGGDGEVEDARAAVHALAGVPGIRRVVVAGYSFGAWIAVKLAATEPLVSAVAAIAPPLAMLAMEAAIASPIPLLLLSGDRDSYCPVPALEAFASSRPESQSILLHAADHFLDGREREAATAVVRFLAALPPQAVGANR